MNRRIAAISIFVFITLIPFLSWAKVAVSLKLDRSQVQLVDSVELTVSVAGSRDSDSRPDIRGLENFDVRSGGTSSRVEFINGKISSGVDYTYFIQPQKIGTFQIGPARILVDGKTYTSNTAKLQVVKPAGEQGAGANSPIFLTAEFSDDTVYVEEQTIYTLKLFLRHNARNINLSLPETKNLIFKQISKPVEYRSTRNGQNYQVIEVRYAVVPSKAGSYAVDPAKMSMTVLQSRRNSARSFFDDPFSSFSSGRPLSVASKPQHLTVRPLPQEGKPPDFSGLVGKFQMWSKLEPVSLKTGESATLTVTVSGQGNVNRIPDLKIPELTHIKIYADKPVLPAINTDFIGVTEKTGVWTERCAQCGNCVLHLTGGICPIARCSKSLLNGPCGGSQDGKCEINPDVDCGWQLIYDRMNRLGQMEKLAEIIPPKDWGTSRDGGPRKIMREDVMDQEEEGAKEEAKA